MFKLVWSFFFLREKYFFLLKRRRGLFRKSIFRVGIQAAQTGQAEQLHRGLSSELSKKKFWAA